MIAAGGALAGAVVAGSGIANATKVPDYGDVRYVFCSDAQTGNEVTYYDNLGKRDRIVTLPEAVASDRWCGGVDVQFGDSTYIWSSIVNANGNYAYAAIYVNGTLVARDEDRSTYGYAAAMTS
ncbi:hypothetical protein [Nocardia lasii]|uniref:Uncharacterized protein n=1 Tax=Nocardia lasii TaxID=1616107 RepID=A0ABW1JQA8_9NOCA